MITKGNTKVADKVNVKANINNPEIEKKGLVEVLDQKPKSKIMQFREKFPEGIGRIVNMRAVLR